MNFDREIVFKRLRFVTVSIKIKKLIRNYRFKLLTVKPLSKYPVQIENQGGGISGNTPFFLIFKNLRPMFVIK